MLILMLMLMSKNYAFLCLASPHVYTDPVEVPDSSSSSSSDEEHHEQDHQAGQKKRMPGLNFILTEQA